MTGASAVQAGPGPDGTPDCDGLLLDGPSVGAPSGGLSGTVTLINVASGVEFSLNAVALDSLASRPFHRPAADDYPDFNAVEIYPVSVVAAGGTAYRSLWTRAADAVSATLMAKSYLGEYVLDADVQANTDAVITFPTRQFHASVMSAAPPFSSRAVWDADCRSAEVSSGEPASVSWFDREQAHGVSPQSSGVADSVLCASANVFDLSNGSAHSTHAAVTRVLGSKARGFGLQTVSMPAKFDAGWVQVSFERGAAALGLTSLPSSSAIDAATGATTSGAHTFLGLPAVGFTVRLLRNGMLACGDATCLGNYGAAFPMKAVRSIRTGR